MNFLNVGISDADPSDADPAKGPKIFNNKLNISDAYMPGHPKCYNNNTFSIIKFIEFIFSPIISRGKAK